MDIKEMRKDILEYDLYEVVDGMPYGNHFVSIFNTEGNQVAILIEDAEGTGTWWAMDKQDFFTYGATVEDLERLLNGILYYTYIEEECDYE
jgi:hypothetical protein